MCKERKILILQRVVPDYRLPFFDALEKKIKINIIYGEAGSNDVVRDISEQRDYLLKTKVKYYLNNRIWWHKNIIRTINELRPSLIILQPTPRCITNFFIFLYGKVNNIPVLGWGMGEMPGRNRIKAWIHRQLQKTSVLPLDAIICYSSVAKKYYREIGFKKKIEIANNAVFIDQEIYNMPPRKGSANNAGLNLLYIGQLTNKKGLEDLINIILRNPVLHLTIVGTGALEYVERLKFLSDSIQERITFLGHINPKDMPRIAMDKDIFVMPSRGGLAINHAMALSLPVLCSIGDGTEKDMVMDGVNGYIFDGWNDLERIILEHITKKDLLLAMGAAGRKLIIEKFSIEKMTQVFVAAACIESALQNP